MNSSYIDEFLKQQGIPHNAPPQMKLDHLPKQQYAIIAAIDADRGFAKDNKIPWYYKEDFVWFRQQTLGHPCIMGRKTYEEINERLGEKAFPSVLPDRPCFVVSRTLDSLPNATVIRNIRGVEFHVNDISKPIFIIGGGRLFIEGLSLATDVYLTIIDQRHQCDMFFPIQYIFKHFVINQVHDSNNPDLKFLKFVRKQG